MSSSTSKPATSTPPYLELRNARVFQHDTLVFEALSLSLWHGENTCILGPNGCGKSTLLKLLNRELYPVVRDDSFVKINGSQTAILSELRQTIGFVSHELQTRYDAHVLGRDVVRSGFFGAVGMHGHDSTNPQQEARVDEVLTQFELNSLQQRRYWHLSTGQQRRFLLARALVHHPKVLILDEPTTGLDIKATHVLLQHLRTLAQNGTTLLLVTHHLHEILPEIARVVLLKEGAIVFDGEKSTH